MPEFDTAMSYLILNSNVIHVLTGSLLSSEAFLRAVMMLLISFSASQVLNITLANSSETPVGQLMHESILDK